MSTTLPITPAAKFLVPSITVPDSDFGQAPIRLRSPVFQNWSDDEFFEFAVNNPLMKIERCANGDLLVMTPAGIESSDWNSEIDMQLRIWAKKDATGKVFESSAGFKLPNGSVISPDASWIQLAKWNRLTKEEKSKFGPFCPDFVLELRSPSDRLIDLQNKLIEFLANGAQLGWIIDPYNKTVHIYRPGQGAEILANPATVSGESVLPGFELDLVEIFTE